MTDRSVRLARNLWSAAALLSTSLATPLAAQAIGGDAGQALVIERPGGEGGVFINQIGDGNQARAAQAETQHFARLDQRGEGNSANVTQTGRGAHYAYGVQTGSDNSLNLQQDGAAAQVALTEQDGSGNRMAITQSGGLEIGGVLALQYGANNLLDLTQNGGDNQAVVRQDGNANSAVVAQNGGNELQLTQTGNNLSIMVDQPAGQAMSISQSN